MTSRALFYKGMIEDLRHRIWMIALSCLASFMAFPVVFLLAKQDWDRRLRNWYPEIGWDMLGYKAESIEEFFNYYMTIGGGIVLGVGALIVGIFGFRYVFSKKMVDLYHSIPITRKQLFFIHYVNGFLIWFLPMLIGSAICAVMSFAFIGDFVTWMSTLDTLAITIANLVLAFLLIYHLAMVAVMLSGNILNTLVSGTIMSFVVLAIYGMYEGFASAYFDTYYSFWGENLPKVIWANPIPGAIYQLVMRCEGMQVFPCVMNVLMAVLLLVLAFVLYLRRPSELAEQGIKIKPVQIIFKTSVTVLAGMAGWMFFGLLTDTDSVGWTVFGSILASVLAYGILDIIFNMDFKAFFKNKIQLALTTIAGILIGFTFMFDWTGFDTYVPDKEQIADMGISISSLTLGGSLNRAYTVAERIKDMEYTDAEVIYTFLNTVTDRERTYPLDGNSATAYVRVTEKSGRTYYRVYEVWESDEELVLPILRDASYVETNFQVPEELMDKMVLDGGNSEEVMLENTFEGWDIRDKEHAKELLKAYNADVLANPDLLIYQDNEIFAKVNYHYYGNQYYNLRLDLYESMENVISVLKKYGYEDVLAETTPKKVATVEMNAYLYDTNNLKVFFGLEEESKISESLKEPAAVINQGDSMEMVTYTVETKAGAYKEYNYHATFEKEEDIAEILDVVTYHRPNNRSIFGPEYTNCDVVIWLKNGDKYYVQLIKGVLPEKFIDDFKKIEILYD